MKKRIIMLGTFLLTLMAFMPMYVGAANIKDSCDNISKSIDIKLPNTVHTAILAIQIAVPVLLVVFGMLDLIKGITAQKEDEIKKGQQIFVKRLMAAGIVFFVTVIVKLLVSAAAGDDEPTIMNCANCFINGVRSNGVCK